VAILSSSKKLHVEGMASQSISLSHLVVITITVNPLIFAAISFGNSVYHIILVALILSFLPAGLSITLK